MAPRKPSGERGKIARLPIRTKRELPAADRPKAKLLTREEHGVSIPDPPVPRFPHKPHALTQRKADILITYARKGASREGQALAAGISVETLYQWLRAGRSGDPRYVALAEALDTEEANHEGDLAESLILQGKAGNVPAALGYLERRHPDRWGHKHTLEVRIKSEFEDFFRHMQQVLPGDVYEQVLMAAASFGSPPALPDPQVIDVEAVE